MKIRTWLLLSYLIVMLLPLLAGYLLFGWIAHYDDKQKVTEHFKVIESIETMKDVLLDERLYLEKYPEEKIDPILKDDQTITLFNKDGLILYTSNQTAPHTALGKSELYKGLYELEQGYYSYEYKEPVFKQNELLGFFKIVISRQAWVTAVSNRTMIVSIVFGIIFIAIFSTVIILMNRKLNEPMTQLMKDMSDFAVGKPIKQKETKKDEIGQLTDRFYKMSEKINEAQEIIAKEQATKEYMIASVSHDLKTPLTSIKAYAESLKNETLSEAEKETYQQTVIDKVDFMEHMLDDLLTYTLLQSPTYEVDRVQVDGAEFFDMLLSGYDALCRQHHVHLKAIMHVDDSYLVSPQQMIRVVDNLMNNAVKYTPENEHIYLAALAKNIEQHWLLEDVKNNFTFDFKNNMYLIVQNKGRGISAENLSHIFSPFYQEDRARQKTSDHGTGLGLSIAKQIIEKHEGTIYIYSEKNTGTCVLCELPKVKGSIVSETD